VEAARALQIASLTLYAFSSDNWRRPRTEVSALMRLFQQYLDAEVDACVREGIRLRVVGRRDRLDPRLVQAIERAEAATSASPGLRLRVAIDYSSRDAILAAAAAARGPELGPPTRHAFTRSLSDVVHASDPIPDVDLLIRTGGEHRLSDFLLWECAYAELLFVDCPWPEFGSRELEAALREFSRRERRFGAIDETPSPTIHLSPVEADR